MSWASEKAEQIHKTLILRRGAKELIDQAIRELPRTFFVLASSLLLGTACLQGGEEPLTGGWTNLITDKCYCYIGAEFGPLAPEAGAMHIVQSSDTAWSEVKGWYTPDGNTLHVLTTAGTWDMKWGLGDVPGRLILDWGSGPIYLFRVKP